MFEFGMGVLFGVWMTLIGALFIVGETPAPFDIVCEYEGGEVQGDVCIRDGRVIEIDLETE